MKLLYLKESGLFFLYCCCKSLVSLLAGEECVGGFLGSVLFGRYLLRMCVAIVTMIKGALDKYHCLSFV